jgi:acetyl-CoA carboxylase biotin carboxyl carrier protein
VSLSAADIQEIMRLVEASGFDELLLETAGTKLTLRRGGAISAVPSGSVPLAAPAVAPVAVAAPEQAPVAVVVPAPVAAPVVADGTAVESPMLGTFYRAPKPGAAPFVEVGSAVEADTVIGIVEVMKLMNTVRAGVRGTLTAVVARDGALVEYGETLIRVAVAE